MIKYNDDDDSEIIKKGKNWFNCYKSIVRMMNNCMNTLKMSIRKLLHHE